MRRDEGQFQSLAPFRAGDATPRGRRGGGSLARVEADPHELRPRGIGELLDVGMEVFRSRFGVYVGVATLLWFPVRLAGILVDPNRWLVRGPLDPSLGFFLAFFSMLLATLVVSILVNALMARLVAAHLEGRSVSVPGALRGVLARSFAIGVIALASGFLMLVGFLLCFLPGVFLTWKLYLAPTICVIEDAGVVESYSRSFELSRGRFLAWGALVLVSFFMLMPFTSVAGMVDSPEVRAAAIRQLGIPSAAFDWISVGFTSLFTGVATAFQGVVVTVFYFDCRARRDGIDLAARLARLGERALGAAAT